MRLRSHRQHWHGVFLLLPFVAALTGCGMGSIDTSVSGTFSISGQVHGGNLPVSGSTIQLYTAGTGGNGSAATAMITTGLPVTTGSDGTFTITSRYNCVHSTDQVYITSTGGNPGLTGSNINNDALVMMAAIGNCG